MTRAARPVKGVVLAAGLGTRLRPLTERWPKPLIPFVGTTPLELALFRLWRAGVSDVALNAHYLPEQIVDAAKGCIFDQKLRVFVEPTILGTGGAYNPMREWQGDSLLVVLNGDVISTIDVQAMIDHHQKSGAVATMMLLPDVIPGESGVSHQDGRVVAIGKDRPVGSSTGNFACAQVLSPEFLDLLPREGIFDIISKGYLPALAQGLPIGALIHAGFWHDLRTPSFFAAAVFDYLKHHDAKDDLVGVRTCRIRRGLSATRIDGVDPVKRSIVLPGEGSSRGSQIADTIVGPGFSVPIQAV